MAICGYREKDGGCSLTEDIGICLHQEREEQYPYEMICTLEIEEMIKND